MNFEEVKKYIDENKGDKELAAYLQGLMGVEGMQKYLRDNENGRSWLDAEKDRHLEKGLKTWKDNNLKKEIDQRILELYPEETEEKKQLRELNAKIEKMETEKQREVLKNKALTIAADKKLPINKIVDLFISDNEEATVSNIGRFEEIYSASVQTAVEERLKSTGYTPPNSTNQNNQPKNLNDALKSYYSTKNDV
jgi:DNA repair exonuclease SbcCD nuclease subunit